MNICRKQITFYDVCVCVCVYANAFICACVCVCFSEYIIIRFCKSSVTVCRSYVTLFVTYTRRLIEHGVLGLIERTTRHRQTYVRVCSRGTRDSRIIFARGLSSACRRSMARNTRRRLICLGWSFGSCPDRSDRVGNRRRNMATDFQLM